VDAGFVWDVTVHHQQAVTMAGYTRDHAAQSGEIVLTESMLRKRGTSPLPPP
jgi:uncharacterized protein (DUF305 family)